MKLGRIVFVFLIFLACSRCSYKDNKTPTQGRLDASSNIGYTEINSAILQPRCLGCHATREPILTSYQAVLANISNIQIRTLIKGTMPPNSPLSQNEQDYLKAWIVKGSPEFSSGPQASAPPPTGPSGPIVRPVTWAVISKSVLEPKCFSCHYPKNPQGSTDYTDRNVLRDTIGTILFTTIVKPQMPPPPAVLNSYEKDLLSAWVVDGMDIKDEPKP